MSNASANNLKNVTNPIPASQVYVTGLDLRCLSLLEDSGISVNENNEIECTSLALLMSGLVGAMCSALDLSDLQFHSCINPEDPSSLPSVLQGIINKVCNVDDCPECPEDPDEPIPGELNATQADQLSSFIDSISLSAASGPYCQSDQFGCDSTDTCITVTDPCDPIATTEELLKAAMSRVVALSNLALKQCETITELESRLDTIEAKMIELGDCCSDTLPEAISTLVTEIQDIKANCCS